MAIQRPLLIKLLMPLLAFGVTLALISLSNRSSDPALPSSDRSSSAYAAMGSAHLQKARDTGDLGFYARAENAFSRALDQDPKNVDALAGMGALALARHDFRTALRYGQQARSVAPGVVRTYGVIVDALVELGRYAAAERTLQRLVDLKPNLASYARVSYLRELHGDLPGAVEAMRLAISAGGNAPENLAYVQTLLGNLELERGRTGAARRAYRTALSSYSDYAAAEAGLARIDQAQGELDDAVRRYRVLVARLPLPEYVIGLAEAELAAGRRTAAQRSIALVGAEQKLLRASAVNTDTEVALFEANHGDSRRAVALARRSWAAAPSVRSADALGWALTRAGQPQKGLAWAKRALELGSLDPLFLYHAGMSARAAGRNGLARRYLARSLARNAHFSPLYAPRARRALAKLS
jgi:tetratricopeptide (TPR) repeat protein